MPSHDTRGDRVARGPPRPVPAPTPKRGDIPITDSDEVYAEYEGEVHPLSETYPDFQGSKSRGISQFIKPPALHTPFTALCDLRTSSRCGTEPQC